MPGPATRPATRSATRPTTHRGFPFLPVIAAMIAAVIATALLAAAAVPAARAAGKQVFLGRHHAWYAYRVNRNGKWACYVVSKPIRSRGRADNRGAVRAFVTDRPSQGERNVFNVETGYVYKDGTSVTVRIADQTFSLFTFRDTAWSRSPSGDRQLVAAMIAGVTMDVTGTPLDGSTTTDVYSLRGFTAAYKRANRACGDDSE